MRKLVFCFCMMVITISCVSKKESEAIKQCFNDYRTGILVSSGDQVVPLLNQNTKNYYQRILEHIKYSQEPTVYKLNVVDRILILSTRNKLSKEEIENLDVASFLNFAINNHMIIRYDYLFDLAFIEVKEIKKNKAKARIKLNRTSKTLIFTFTKEMGKWKINLSPIIQLNTYAMSNKVKKMGILEDDFAMDKIKEENNGMVKKDIWEAPLKR